MMALRVCFIHKAIHTLESHAASQNLLSIKVKAMLQSRHKSKKRKRSSSPSHIPGYEDWKHAPVAKGLTGKFEFGLKSGRSASNVAVASTGTEMHPSVDKNPKKQRRNKGSKVKKSEANSEKNDIKYLLPDINADANTKKKRKPRGKQFEPVTRMVDGNWRIPGPGVAQPLYGLEGHLENDLNYKEDPMNGVIQHLKDVNGSTDKTVVEEDTVLYSYSTLISSMIDDEDNKQSITYPPDRYLATMEVPLGGRRLEYMKEVQQNKLRASRSVLVYADGTNAAETDEDVMEFCRQYGAVESIDTVHVFKQQHQRCLLVEFQSIASADSMMKSLGKTSEAHLQRAVKLPRSKTLTKAVKKNILYAVREKEEPRFRNMRKCVLNSDNSIGSCVIAVQKLVAPSHLSDRLNYLQCQMFDDLMRVYNYSPQSQTIPHGSALSMLGTSGGDLDMCMHPYGLEGYYCQPGGHETVSWKAEQLLYDAIGVRPTSASFGGNMVSFMYKHLKRHCTETGFPFPIPNAKVPILRFYSMLTMGQCDVCISPFIDDSVMASLILRMLCEHDRRFVYLNRCLRFWAKQHELTSAKAGRYLINFSLTHMLVYYLQHLDLLPSVNHIVSQDYERPTVAYKPSYVYDTEFTQQHEDELGTLYREFFSFWAAFDFEKTIDISTADASIQNEFLGNPLKITNMVNPDKNIAFRMSREYLDRFVLACGETYVGLLRHTDNMPETFCDVHNIDE